MIPSPIVVFVRPQAHGNIGALARAMSNFGCTELRLVSPTGKAERNQDPELQVMEWALAAKGKAILEKARWYPSLREALADTHYALGTSGRDLEFPKGYGRPLVTPEEALRTLRDWTRDAAEAGESLRWAVVLGPEDDGLEPVDAALCQKLLRLPTVDLNPSLNVAMAAGLFLYHWHLANRGSVKLDESFERGPFMGEGMQQRLAKREAGRGEWANTEQKERLLDYLCELLSHTDFFKFPDHAGIRARLRRWLQVCPMPVSELLYGFEMLYQIRAWGTGSFGSRDFLSPPKITSERTLEP